MFGMFGPLMGQLQQPLPQDAGKPKHKSGMFGGGKPDWVSAIAAGLGALSAARGNPAGQIGIQMLNQRLGQKREDQQYEQRRQAELQDYGKKLEMQAQYQQPRVNDTVEDYNFRVQKLGQEAADDWLRNPAQYVNIPGVGLVQMPRVGAPQQNNAKPVGKLTPIEDEGGPSPLGSGGFSFPF
jgi:hypothetical protein